MNTVSQTIDILAGKAEDKAKLSVFRTLMLGVLAGAFIAIGAFAFIHLSALWPVLPKNGGAWTSLATFLGACAFPFGLVGIVFIGGELATGNMMVMPLGMLAKKTNLLDLIRNWILVMIGNFIGSVLIAYVLGKLANGLGGDFAAKTMAVGLGKVVNPLTGAGLSPLAVIASGIGCNIFVCIAVFLATMTKDAGAKFFAVWFPIMLFVACGFQHVVANMFFIPAAMMQGAHISMGQLFGNIGLVFIGNAIAGVVFVALPIWFTGKPKVTETV